MRSISSLPRPLRSLWPVALSVSLFLFLVVFPSAVRADLELAIELGSGVVRAGAPAAPAFGPELPVRIVVSNSGATTLDEVVVTVPLSPDYLTIANLGILGGACDSLIGNRGNCNAPETITFPIGSLPRGTGRTVGFSLGVTAVPTDGDVSISARATAGGEVVEAARAITVLASPAYELAVTADRDPLGAGEALTYDIVWGHVATSRIAPSAVVTFDLPAAVTVIDTSPGGEVDGSTVRWSVGDLAPGDSGAAWARVRAADDLADGALLAAQAEISDAGDDVVAFATAHSVVRAETDAPLALVLEIGPDPVRPGEADPGVLGRTVDVRLIVTNRGAFELPDVTVEAPLPVRLAGVNARGTVGGTCDSIIGNVGSCFHPERGLFAVGDLAPGAGRTVGFSAFARDLPEGSILRFDAHATSPIAGVQAVAERAISSRGAPNFEIGLVASQPRARPGSPLEFELTWGHVATARVAEDAVLAFEPPLGTEIVSASHGGTISDGNVSWDLGHLQPGDSGARSIVVAVAESAPAGETLEARAWVEDATGDLEASRARCAVRVGPAPPVRLELAVAPGRVPAGEAFEVSVTVENAASFDVPGVRIDLPLPARIATLVRTTIEDGTCDSLIGIVNRCNFPERVIFDLGTLPAGATRTRTFEPAMLSGDSAPADGSIVRWSAFLSSALGHDLVQRDVLVGEDGPSFTGRFVRGDSNADARVDLTDAIATLGYLFLGSSTPSCLDAADTDDSARIDLSDPILVLSFLFLGGGPPAPPWGGIPEACGEDPTPDDGVSCLAYVPCDA